MKLHRAEGKHPRYT